MKALTYCLAIGVGAAMLQVVWWLGQGDLALERARRELAENHAERLMEDARRARELCVPCDEARKKHGRIR